MVVASQLPRSHPRPLGALGNRYITTFRDIDYDDDPTQRTVRIVGIQEAATQPSDHGTWGDSLIILNRGGIK